MVLMFLLSLLSVATAAKDVAMASTGFCGPTVDEIGDCDSGNSGSWRIEVIDATSPGAKGGRRGLKGAAIQL
eukprot:scaffold56797_cov75-Phaeocystis_antarctica.AAC.1